ncbi:hypothetical protein AADV15_000821 [Campylobacter coli]
MNPGTQSLFSHACDVKDFTLSILNNKSSKSIELKTGETKSGEISFNGFIVLAYFTINGTTDLQYYLDQSGDMRFIPFILDASEGYYRREFQVVKNNKTQTTDKSSFTIQGQDLISYLFSKLYIAKTYKNKKLSDIFKDIYDTYIKPKLKYNPDSISLELSSNIVIENFVLTSRKSVLDFILEECNRQGLILFQDKQKIVMKPYKELKPNNLKLQSIQYDDFKKDPNNPYDILSRKIINTNQALKLPKSQIIAFDKATKTMKVMKVNLEDLDFDVPVESQDHDGFEYQAQEYLYDDNIFADTYKSFLDYSKLELVVPGVVKAPEIFTKYKVLFKSNENTNETQEGDIKISGEYILTGFIDKIESSQFYITKLILSRFKDTDIQ